jgi:hypothetical protein
MHVTIFAVGKHEAFYDTSQLVVTVTVVEKGLIA